jgi:cytoskeletal protein RodZ
VQATDRSGKRLNKVLTIRRQVQIDTTAPQFALLQPAQGTISTKAPTPASRQELQSAGLSGDRGVKFLGDIELEAGNNPVKVTVEDSHGNVGSKVFTIERRK